MTDVGYDAKGWVLDLSDVDAITPVIEKIAVYFGGVDILFNKHRSWSARPSMTRITLRYGIAPFQ